MSGDSAGPAIGVTLPSPAADPGKQRRANRATACYRSALQDQRAGVVELSPHDPVPGLDNLDGILLTGGGDLHPTCYGAPSHPKLSSVDRARDQFELTLTRAALARGLPILGICRGAQVLGVALGGGLIQDIDSQVPHAEKHSSESANAALRHYVRISPDARLRQIMRAERVRVSSSHHQANGRLGPGVRAVAWAQDGVVEAIEGDGAHFVVGVQWHPERMWRRAPRQRRLFAAFVAAARESARTRLQRTRE